MLLSLATRGASRVLLATQAAAASSGSQDDGPGGMRARVDSDLRRFETVAPEGGFPGEGGSGASLTAEEAAVAAEAEAAAAKLAAATAEAAAQAAKAEALAAAARVAATEVAAAELEGKLIQLREKLGAPRPQAHIDASDTPRRAAVSPHLAIPSRHLLPSLCHLPYRHIPPPLLWRLTRRRARVARACGDGS